MGVATVLYHDWGGVTGVYTSDGLNRATHAHCQQFISLFSTISWDLLKLMSIELVMPSNHLILCHPHCLLPTHKVQMKLVKSK